MDEESHVPDEGVIDDRNTIESQLSGKSPVPHLPAAMEPELNRSLAGLKFPANKTEAYEYALARQASDAVLEALDKLHREAYENYEQVKAEVKDS